MIMYNNSNIKSITCSKEQLLITWHMTGWCNYKCPYCIAKSFETKWIPEDQIINIADKINEYINKYKENQRVVIRAVGGEVTYYDLPKIFEHIQHLDKINIATNFSRDLDYFKELITYFAERKTQLILTCSLHEENEEFKEKFIALTKWCRANKYRDPHMMIVVQPGFTSEDIKDYLDNDVWKIRLSRCRNNETQKNEPLDSTTLEYLYNHTQYYNLRTNTGVKKKPLGWNIELLDNSSITLGSGSDLTNFIDNDGFIPDNYYCSVGKNSLTVLPNGDVTLSRCEYLKDRVIGNIFDYDNLQLPDGPILCKLNSKPGSDKRCDLCSGANLIRSEFYSGSVGKLNE